MKRIIASLLVLLTLISIPSLSAADTASLALQADSAYNREDYRAAIDLYRAAIAAAGPSTVVSAPGAMAARARVPGPWTA